MGYQVGNQCFESKELAENHYFSLVVPQIKDGQIVQPKKIGNQWQLNGQAINAYLPTCDPAENFRSGAELGLEVFMVMAAMYTFLILKKIIK